MNPTIIHENGVSIPGLAQLVKGSTVALSCSVGHRHSSDLALLWLWCRAEATALILPLAWELQYAVDEALKKKKKKKVQRVSEKGKLSFEYGIIYLKKKEFPSWRSG